MSDNIALLMAMSTKEGFDSIRHHVQNHTVNKYTRRLVMDMEEYYDATGKDTLELPAFKDWFYTVKHRTTSDTVLSPYSLIFGRWETVLDDGTLAPEVALIQQEYAKLDHVTRIADIATRIVDGDNSLSVENIKKQIEEYETTAALADSHDPDELDPNEASSSITDCLAEVSGDGLQWRLEELNVSCGPLRLGDFVEIAAYVDTGKTSFLASEITHMAPQLGPDDYALWINNEERSGKVRGRIYSAAIGKSIAQIKADPFNAEKEYEAVMGKPNRIRLLTADGMSIRDLDRILLRIKPKLIIIDMQDKVSGYEDEARDDLRLGKLYNWARNVAKTYGPVIAASQVSGDAENMRYISMGQLAGSRTAKQAEADAIITIGRLTNPPPGEEAKRFIHVPKNKLDGGGPSFNEAERNGKWEVEIQTTIARYKGMSR